MAFRFDDNELIFKNFTDNKIMWFQELKSELLTQCAPHLIATHKQPELYTISFSWNLLKLYFLFFLIA